MKPDVYICGCSFSTGFYKKNVNPLVPGKNNPYPEIFCNLKHLSYINLAFNGASNYAIAKQVEYAISMHPKLIVLNITTPMRIDWTRPEYRLTYPPTIKDIVYNDVLTHPLNPEGSAIRSMPISTYLALGNPDRIFVDYMYEYVDPRIKADSDRLLILGMVSLLTKSNIPFIAVNFAKEIGRDVFPEVYDVFWQDMRDKFTISTDDAHFNQTGHVYLAKKLETRFSLPNFS